MKKLSLLFVLVGALSGAGLMFGVSEGSLEINGRNITFWPHSDTFSATNSVFYSLEENERATTRCIDEDGAYALVGFTGEDGSSGCVMLCDNDVFLENTSDFISTNWVKYKKYGFQNKNYVPRTSEYKNTFFTVQSYPSLLHLFNFKKSVWSSSDPINSERLVWNWARIFGVFGTGAALAAVAAGVWKYFDGKKHNEQEDNAADVEEHQATADESLISME